MQAHEARRRYRPTEAKYKGGAREMYITYDLEQTTRGGSTAVYPKVKRVYIAGDVKNWEVGDFTKKSGKRTHGVRIEYERRRGGYHRRGFTAHRGRTTYTVRPATIKPATQRFVQVVEVPKRARNVSFRKDALPARYDAARQDVR